MRGAGASLTETVAMVDAIRDRALSLGWTEQSLYGTGGTTRALFGKACGLANLLKTTDQIGEVTRQSIEIILANGVRQRFYNPDVETALDPSRAIAAHFGWTISTSREYLLPEAQFGPPNAKQRRRGRLHPKARPSDGTLANPFPSYPSTDDVYSQA